MDEHIGRVARCSCTKSVRNIKVEKLEEYLGRVSVWKIKGEMDMAVTDFRLL